MKPRVALFAFVGLMLLMHAYLAYIYPLQRDDWSHLIWHAKHDNEGTIRYLRSFFATHFTVADAAGYVVARWQIAHALLTSVSTVAMVFGVFVLAHRRLPRSSWRDTLAIVFASAAIWIAQSHVGLSFFHGPYVAMYLYGTTIALWFGAAYLCRWRLRPWQQVLVVLAGLFAGAASRQVAVTTLVAVIVLVIRTPREARRAWMWIGIATTAIGTVLGFMDTPQIALKSFVTRGYEANLALAYIPFREGGQLPSLMLLLALGKLVLDRLRPKAPAAPADLPDTRAAIVWFALWLWLCCASLLGPKVSSGTALPATAAVCIGVLPFVDWLIATRPVRLAVVAIAIGVHVVCWALAVTTMLPLYRQFDERMSILETTPKGSIAKIPPYTVIYQTPWFFGEDFQFPGPRQLLAIEVFGLRDIEFSPSFGRNELNPRVQIRFESTGLTAQDLADANAPEIWATELVAARQQFDALLKTLVRRQRKTGFTAKLVVDDLVFPELRGRPLLGAWFDGTSTMSPRVSTTPPDDAATYTVRVPSVVARQFSEAYALYPDGTRRVSYAGSGYPVLPMSTQRHAVVVCDQSRCLALDAFIPWF
ncbi:MAG: DUF6056 family protein [Kofleriaceae bacterium]